MCPESGNILIVDDERAIRASLRTILGSYGFSIVEAARGEEALESMRSRQFDAVLLDLNMPGMNGIEACKQMRASDPRLPIIMLTVQEGEDWKVAALDAGADDYVTKPFQLRELVARLRAAIRRNKFSDLDEAEQAIVIGDLLLDPSRHTVEKKGAQVRLTPKQFELLRFLMAHAGKPIPHARLLRSVWGPEYGSEVEYLRTFIRQLRTKIEDDPGNPKYLLTDLHIGYRFENNDGLAA